MGIYNIITAFIYLVLATVAMFGNLTLLIICYLFGLFINIYSFQKNYDRKLNLITFVFFIVNLYTITPLLSFLFTGVTDLLDYNYDDTRFGTYLSINIIFNFILLLFTKREKKHVVTKDFYVPKKISLSLLFVGILVMYLQLYMTGAFQLIPTGNKGLILSTFYQFPSLYEYPIYIGLFFYIKQNKRVQIRSINDIIFFGLIISYFIFWFTIGSRGEMLIVIFIGFYAYEFKNRLSLNFKSFLILFLALSGIITSTLIHRWKLDYSVTEVIRFVKNKPEVVSLGDFEYNWALRNFNNLEAVNFQQEFFGESYLKTGLGFLARIMGHEFRHPVKRYRDIYHPERKVEGGEYSSTGFSLFYEAKMTFGMWFTFIPFSFFIMLIYWISKKSHKNIYFATASILIMPNLLVLARSGLPFSFIFTKLFYAFIIINLISYLTSSKIIYGIRTKL